METMNIVNIITPANFYSTRVMKFAGLCSAIDLFYAAVLTALGQHTTIYFLLSALLVLPFAFITIAFLMYKYRHHIIAIDFVDDSFDIYFYKFWKREKTKVKVEDINFVINGPGITKYGNYVLIIKQGNRDLIKQFKIDGWNDGTFKQMYENLKDVPGVNITY